MFGLQTGSAEPSPSDGHLGDGELIVKPTSGKFGRFFVLLMGRVMDLPSTEHQH